MCAILKAVWVFLLQRLPSNKDKKQTVKPMSAADEKQMDEAIAIANEFAQICTKEETTMSAPPQTESDGSAHEASPKSKLFSLHKKSPKEEKPTFTEEMAKTAELTDDVSPEAQEAYNILVVKGSVKKREPSKGERLSVRERRTRRSLEHQQHESPKEKKKNGRPVNMNIREPRIPGRRPIIPGGGGGDEVDTNPLRRLRDSQVMPPRPTPRPPSAEYDSQKKTSNGDTPPKSTSLDSIRRPNLVAQSHFVSRCQDPESQCESRQRPLSSGDDTTNNVALPPRRPLRPGTINTKPRERKFPLDTDRSEQSQHIDSEGHSDQHSDQPSSANQSSSDLNTTHESEDSIFDSDAEQKQTQKFQSLVHKSQFCVKNVRLTAEQLGINDNSDTFWCDSVNFEDFPEVIEPGIRYKTPDNVSYEDLMEFALDSDE